MKKLKVILIISASLIVATIALNAINILQAGSREADGRTMAQILGTDPQVATYDDVEKLSRKDKMQLFYAAAPPAFSTLNGEYEARLLSGGILGPASALFTHHVFPTGLVTTNTRWTGKAFTADTQNSGHGYNIFTRKNSDGTLSTLRIRPMRTSPCESKIGKDKKTSFCVDYSADNSGTIHSMKDEIRQINPDLFIGAGYMGLGGGPMNPAPFALIGPPSPWVGPDE